MLLSAVSVLVVAQSSSEIPEGLMNNPVHNHPQAVCLTCLQPPQKRVLQTARSSASCHNFQYCLLPLKSSSNCLPLLPRLPVTSIFTSIFPSITCFTRQFLRNMWPTQLAFLHFIACRKSLFPLTPELHEGKIDLLLHIFCSICVVVLKRFLAENYIESSVEKLIKSKYHPIPRHNFATEFTDQHNTATFFP